MSLFNALVPTDLILFPYLIGFSLWIIKSIIAIREQQIRIEEQLNCINKLFKKDNKGG